MSAPASSTIDTNMDCSSHEAHDGDSSDSQSNTSIASTLTSTAPVTGIVPVIGKRTKGRKIKDPAQAAPIPPDTRVKKLVMDGGVMNGYETVDLE